jgi:hypothetical protein
MVPLVEVDTALKAVKSPNQLNYGLQISGFSVSVTAFLTLISISILLKSKAFTINSNGSFGFTADCAPAGVMLIV